ncbi:phage portal protein [Mobiluncus mulieris]|uniref:Phage portal protein n=1 Tax=Mobiluncus mulieris TaxID=2052 RepID=A0A378PDM9_9ACTO|nr:phage portal protein [Mobiluncus mulieris]NMW64600.1 phage portal protein [Mobiluncus mulieris]STY84685.1 Phage portal protein, SPP1 Gp6-like [Mobiluncus mulieris]
MEYTGEIPLQLLTETEAELAKRCITQITAHSRINKKRSDAYEARMPIRHFDISVPPQMKSMQTVLGWPAKAVDIFEGLLELDGFVIPEHEPKDYGIDQIEAENRMEVEIPQAHTTALKYGCAFLAVTQGGEGEPAAVIRGLSPMNSTVLWDRNRRRAVAAFTASSDGETGEAFFTLFLDSHTVHGYRDSGRWVVEREAHALGEVPVALMPFKPSMEEPFGRSRITQSVMAITERAVRTLLRMEVAAEFYSMPQRVIMGLGMEDFETEDGLTPDKWALAVTKVLALPPNEEGQTPGVTQFTQGSSQPFVEMLRSEAALFAGETNIPVNVLGIIHENPASDAAMHTAYLALNKDAERAQITFGAGVVKAMQLAWRIANGGAELPVELKKMRARYRDPATPTKAALAQSVVSLVQAGVLPAVSPTTYRLLGYEKPDIETLLAEARRQSGGFSLLEMLAKQSPSPELPNAGDTTSQPDPGHSWPYQLPSTGGSEPKQLGA